MGDKKEESTNIGRMSQTVKKMFSREDVDEERSSK